MRSDWRGPRVLYIQPAPLTSMGATESGLETGQLSDDKAMSSWGTAGGNRQQTNDAIFTRFVSCEDEEDEDERSGCGCV